MNFLPSPRHVVSVVIALSAALVVTTPASAGDPGKIVVQVDKPGAKISPMLYGLMTEEINYSYDGGIYGELIQNRTLKNPPRGNRGRGGGGALPTSTVPHWAEINSDGSQGDISLDTNDPVNTVALTTSLKLNIASVAAGGHVGVANDGFWGIRVGRARTVTGPFLDNIGVDMIQGGGKLFAGSEGRVVGPGHFGLLDLGDGVQKWSCHYEADLDRGGASVLDIRPLLWEDEWPVAGENLTAGSYEIQSARTGTSLSLAVEGVPVGGGRRGRAGGGGRGGRRGGAAGGGNADAVPAQTASAGTNAPDLRGARGGGGGRGLFAGQGGVIPTQDVAQVSTNWPAGNIDPRMDNYMDQAQQKWAITVVTNAGGYPGSPYFKITIAGTDRALATTEDMELTTLPVFTGGPEQLWRFDQLADGTWRIMPKSVPNSNATLALSAIGSSFATLEKFDRNSDRQRWMIKAP